MARPWLKLEPALVNHPKTLRLATLWHCHPYEVVGFLVSLWGYCLEYQEDGNVDGLPPDVLGQSAAPCLSAATGTPSSVREALEEVGFVDPGGQLHDWDEYTGDLIEQRRKDRERKRLERIRAKKGVRGTGRGQSADRRRTSGSRVEQSRVDTTTPRAPSASPPSETWLTPYYDAWVAVYGGKPNAGLLAKHLRPLHDEHGLEKTLDHLKKFLAAVPAQYVKVSKFAETFGSWENPIPNGSAPRALSGVNPGDRLYDDAGQPTAAGRAMGL